MLTIESLSKSYGPVDAGGGRRGRKRRAAAEELDRLYAVDGVSFDVQDGELFTLLGPSGCGKTTTLRSVAGLERPDKGLIELNGKAMFDGIKGSLAHGDKMLSKTIGGFIGEGVIAQDLGALQQRYPALDIGSYPFFRQGKFGASFVIRGTDAAAVGNAADELRKIIRALGAEPIEGEADAGSQKSEARSDSRVSGF